MSPHLYTELGTWGRPHETLTQCWANVGPPSTMLSNISPVLGYRVVFGATLNVGQRHRWRAKITQLWIKALCWFYYATSDHYWPGNVSV